MQFEMDQGTLDVAHDQTIIHTVERGSDKVLQVEHGSLYPLHRLESRSWIASFGGTSENNRKAKYYRLTADGRKQLASQTSRWEQVVRAIGRILKPATEQS
jgi:PadR family transcriptional regulator PadR